MMKGPILRLSFATILMVAVATVDVNPSLAAPTKLLRLSATLPFARSGETYSFRLNATGGTPPYHCAPMHLTNSGSVSLNADCVISGTAPVVSYERITGPFTFVLTDSGTPRQRVEFTGMNFTTKRAPFTARDFDGKYSCNVSGSLTGTNPDGTKTVVPYPSTSEFSVTDGILGNKTISIVNEFGDGSAAFLGTFNGITVSETATFTRALSGSGVTVLLLQSGRGIMSGFSMQMHASSHCHRTVIAK